MAPFAFVTLLTTDSYLPGALVTAHSIREAEGPAPAAGYDTVCLVTPETVSVQSIRALRKAFTLVVGVEEIRSDSRAELALLGRRDLASSLTKLHLFRLIQYRKVIFLDADTLVLRPLSPLFNLPYDFSAAPDSGWPDCFNAGMMVCTPASEVFDALLQMVEERGSWDGGDQGLLNDYFTTWHRLSFTYNVTPSAYYTYAPAYRRHGQNISLVHFIGSEKPWHRLSRHRPGSGPSAASGPDYNTLVSRWYDVYERAYGPVSTASLAGQPSGAFTVPTYASAWDAPRASRYVPPTPEQLKAIFTRGGTGVSEAFADPELVLQGDATEGAYLSLPMPGRPSLMRRSSSPPVVTKPAEELAAHPPPPSEARPARVASPPSPSSSSAKSVRFAPSPPKSPPLQAWDAAHAPPPTSGYQMATPFTNRYDAAWDEPKGEQAKVTFRPPASYGSVPMITHQDYSRMASTAPDASAVKAVFPWEKREGGGPTAGRVFPDDPLPASAPLPDLSKPRSPTELQAQQPATSVPFGAPMTMRYVNAWDSDPHIKRYAAALASGSGSSRNGSETRRAASSAGGGVAAEGEADEGGSSSVRGPRPRSRQTASYSERESDASSRDGDDEDNINDDESDGGSPVMPRTRIDRVQNGPNASHVHASTSPPSANPILLAGATSDVLPSVPHAPEGPRRPQLTRGAGSAGSVNRLPTVKSVIVGVPVPPSASGARGSGLSSPVLPRDAQLRPRDLKEKARNMPVSPLFAPSRPSPNAGGTDQSAKASRVFSPTTDTGTLKKSGLDALKRFVQDMERNGGSGRSSGTTSGAGTPR